MARPPARDKETQELIQRFRAKRARRRRRNVALACLLGVAVVALVAAAAILLTRDREGQAVSDSSTGSTFEITTAPAPSSTVAAGPASTSTPSASTTTTRPTTTTTAPTTTTTPPTSSTSTSAPTSTTAPPSSRKIVVIDPGHQAKGDSSTEPVGPGSSEKKPKVSSGTAGVVTGTPESELVLAIALKLRDSLAAHGIEVIMTRTTQDVSISNIERAQVANEARADLFIRIHADGADNSATNGIHTLYPASIDGWTDDISDASKQVAGLVQRELIAATGAKDRGIDARGDMTGFNWSDVPAIIPEIGFMTNPDEDRLLANEDYRNKIVEGLTRAILGFLGVS